MKKVLLSAAALMIGAIGFAQTGPAASTATPIAGSPANANVAESDQWGTDQRLQIIQVGERNSARATQYNDLGYDNNEAFIQQAGPNGYWFGQSYADDNVAEAIQQGRQNETSLIQSGLRNNALSEQGTGLGISEGNRVNITQGAGDFLVEFPPVGSLSADNFAYALQNGDDNSAMISQDHDNNEADSDQDGDDNAVQIVQTSNRLFAADGHLADVEQDGDDNEALVEQDGLGGSNMAYTTQEGAYNEAYQTQYNTGGAGADVNTATIDQLDSYNARAYQSQVGEGNDASISQEGGEWYPDYDSNYAEQWQIGDDNTASITQDFDGNNGPFPPAEEDNYAKQYQKGDRNDASIDQDGEGNKAYQSQWGDDNYITSEQDGHDNKLAAYQWGDDNYAMTAQTGSNNHGLINQTNGQSADLYQNGNGNSANIFQAGPGGGSFLGCSFGPQLDIPNPDSVDPITVNDPCATGNCN
jgi:hypothetical protein